MRILYIGDAREGTNSRLRAQALVRIGHEVEMVSLEDVLGARISSRWFGRFCYRTGFRFMQGAISRRLHAVSTRRGDAYDLVWVNSGEWFGMQSVRALRGLGKKRVLYVNDDPTGPRDPWRWRTFFSGVPEYDLIAIVRECSASELRALQARRVLRVWMSYDEIAHAPPQLSVDDRAAWNSDVSFVGTWMPERGPFMMEMLRQGISLSIWGDRWPKAPEWPMLKAAYRGPPLGPADYAKAVVASKISLGLLSKGNRDLHTRRSSEIPYIGGLFCAERTREHDAMYRDGEEAVFWSSAAECAAACHELLADDGRRERIRRAGAAKVRQLQVGNEDVCRQVLDTLQNEA